MKIMLRATLLIFFMSLFSASAWADDYADTKKMFEDAGASNMFSTAYGYALFPTIGKAGFIVGGAYGKGRVYEQGNDIGEASVTQASVGFQLGASGFSQVVFFENKQALDEFTSGNFEFAMDASAIALTSAAGASASTAGNSATASGGKNNATTAGGGYHRGMATFTIAKGGLMFEASVGGQKFSFTKR